jgi:phosphate starvation-inducible membrane PsiE
MKLERAEAMNQQIHTLADVVGKLLTDGFHYLALFAIGGVIVWSSTVAFLAMTETGYTSIDDILCSSFISSSGRLSEFTVRPTTCPCAFSSM